MKAIKQTTKKQGKGNTERKRQQGQGSKETEARRRKQGNGSKETEARKNKDRESKKAKKENARTRKS